MTEPDKTEVAMPTQFTPFEIKELVVEYAMRNYRSNDNGMTTNLKLEDLERMISFEPENLEELDFGAPSYTGTDLYTASENLRYEAERNAFLCSIGKIVNSDQGLRKQVGAMADEELIKLGDPAKDLDLLLLPQKFLRIAGKRMKAAVLASDPQGVYDSQREDYDFEVILTTLRGGYAGTMQKQTLYFNFSEKENGLSSYHTFLARLQEATQLSVIPPLEPGEPYRNYSGSREDTRPQHGDDSSPVNALGIMLPTPPASFTTSTAPRQRRDAKGYTVFDGAWFCTSTLLDGIIKGRLGEERDKKITDKDSYNNMVQILKSQTVLKEGKPDKPPPGALKVYMIHAMDQGAIKKFHQEHNAALAEESRFHAKLRAQGLTDEDIGEPYGAYLTKHLENERERLSMGHYSEQFKRESAQHWSKRRVTVKENMLSKYSPKFAQAPFDAHMEVEKGFIADELKEKLRKIPRHTSYF